MKPIAKLILKEHKKLQIIKRKGGGGWDTYFKQTYFNFFTLLKKEGKKQKGVGAHSSYTRAD